MRYDVNLCPPVNVLLVPEHSRGEEYKDKVEEHLKRCEKCRDLVSRVGTSKNNQDVESYAQKLVEVPGMKELMQAVATTVIGLYKMGIPKSYLLSGSGETAFLVYEMIDAYGILKQTLGNLMQIERPGMVQLWTKATEGTLRTLEVLNNPSTKDNKHVNMIAKKLWPDSFQKFVDDWNGPNVYVREVRCKSKN